MSLMSSVDQLPRTGGADGETELLEREHELAALTEVLDRAQDGRGAVVLVEGAAGVGKSSILRAAQAIADRRRITVLAARGSELETGLPFGVARQLFPRGDLRADGLRAATDHERQVALLTRFQDELSAAVLGGDEPTPQLLLVDDAQWADPPSLACLAHLVLRTGQMPVAIVVGVRTGDTSLPRELQHLRRGETARALAPQRL